MNCGPLFRISYQLDNILLNHKLSVNMIHELIPNMSYPICQKKCFIHVCVCVIHWIIITYLYIWYIRYRYVYIVAGYIYSISFCIYILDHIHTYIYIYIYIYVYNIYLYVCICCVYIYISGPGDRKVGLLTNHFQLAHSVAIHRLPRCRHPWGRRHVPHADTCSLQCGAPKLIDVTGC